MEQIQNPDKMIRVGVIPADDAVQVWYKEVSRDFSGTPNLRELVGGWIEIVRPMGFTTLNEQTGRRHILIVDEEGRLKGKPFNRRASMIYGWQRHGEPIVGDAVVATEALLWAPEDRIYEPDVYGLPADFKLRREMIDL